MCVRHVRAASACGDSVNRDGSFTTSWLERLYLRRVEECVELVAEVRFLEEENLNLRAQLALWDAKRTLGGPAKPYTSRWGNEKLSPMPPPYEPAIDTGRVS